MVTVERARELIAIRLYGYVETETGTDVNGENNSVVLSSPRGLPDGYVYPPKGKIHRLFHVPHWEYRDLFPELITELIFRFGFHVLFTPTEIALERDGLKISGKPSKDFDFKVQVVQLIGEFLQEAEA